jgi:large subunit ribosomal protein L25
MKKVILEAEPRNSYGKGTARKLRSSGRIPAIFYSSKSPAIPISIKSAELEKVLKDAKGGTEIITLNIKEDSQILKKMTILKEVQRHVVQQTLLHADLWEVDMEKELEVEVPIKLVGKPVGLTDGGVLEQLRREVVITCRPDNLVENVVVDVSGLNIGDTLHVFDIDPGEGRKIAAEMNYAIATVAAPMTERAEKVEEETAEEATEAASAEEK